VLVPLVVGIMYVLVEIEGSREKCSALVVDHAIVEITST
jgi:hypothetical protein